MNKEKEIEKLLYDFYKKREENIAFEVIKGIKKRIQLFYFKRLFLAFGVLIFSFFEIVRQVKSGIEFGKINNSWQFISLLFSDTKIVLQNMNIYLLSLVENTPFMELVYALFYFSFILLSLLIVSNTLKFKKVKLNIV